uniref:Uncharacterized protein n=1 Tax=Brassica campestris TaxID=3711 RepID=A0A3P5YQE9_BRACM|nr:unnamed protein product [Brassica rapa]
MLRKLTEAAIYGRQSRERRDGDGVKPRVYVDGEENGRAGGEM